MRFLAHHSLELVEPRLHLQAHAALLVELLGEVRSLAVVLVGRVAIVLVLCLNSK